MTCACGNASCVGNCGYNCLESSCSCGCNPNSQAVCGPYYNQALGCQESHVEAKIYNQYSAGLSVANAFNMPACDETVLLVIPGLQLVNIGSYLWHPTYGYLKIMSFDYANSTVVVKNECQDGNAAEGTSISACTVFNVVDSPVGIDNPCTNSPVVEGALIVCKDGVSQALDASAVGQVPVVTDATNNLVEFQSVDLPTRVCTELTADLTLVAGNSGPYTLTVTSTSIFTSAYLIQIGGRSERYLIISILGPTQVQVTCIPTPAGWEVVPSGTAVCVAPCCEQLEAKFDNPCDWDLSDRMSIHIYDTGTTAAATTIIHDGQSVTAPDQLATATNYKCVTKALSLDVSFFVNYENVGGNAGDTYDINLECYVGFSTGLIGAAPAATPTLIRTLVDSKELIAGHDRTYAMHYHYHQNYLISAGYELKLVTRAVLNCTAVDAGVQVRVLNLSSSFVSLEFTI